jgi:phage-related protein (TIGR01555 family)
MGNPASDRKESGYFSGEVRLGEMVCRNLYTYSGLARTIVDMLVDDGLKKWFTIEGDTDNIMAKEAKRLSMKRQISRVWKYSRSYGGAVLVMMANDGRRLDEPLDEANIRDIEKLRVFHRWRTSRLTYYLDPNDPKYSETETFLITPTQPFQRSFIVHESRCLIFDGLDVAPEIRQGNQWWGDSIYQSVYQRLRGLGEGFLNVEHIIGEFLLMITKIKGLAQKLASGQEKEVSARIMLTNMTRNLMGSYLLDADGEDATRISASVAGLDKLMEILMMGLSADVRYPIRKLFGTPIQAAGLGKDGDEETADYDNHVVGTRQDECEPQLERLCKLIMLQKAGPFHGSELANWAIKWPAIREDSMATQLANKKVQSEIDTSYYQMGLDPADILNSRFGGDSYSHDTKMTHIVKPEGKASQEDDQGEKNRAD